MTNQIIYEMLISKLILENYQLLKLRYINIEKENLYTAESPVNRGFTALLQKNGVCLVFKYM